MCCSVIHFIIGANCAVETIEIWVLYWAILALTVNYIINLLVWTCFTLQVSIIPIFWMFAQYTSLAVPILALSLVTHTSFQTSIINTLIRAVITRFILFILPFRTKRAGPITKNKLLCCVNACATLTRFNKYFLFSTVNLYTISYQN